MLEVLKRGRYARACSVVGKHLTHREKCQIYRAHARIESGLLLPHALFHPQYTHRGVVSSMQIGNAGRACRLLSVMKSELLFLLARLSSTWDTHLFFREWSGRWGRGAAGGFKAMRKCSVMDSQGWRGEDPKLRKQTVSKLNIETKPSEVDTKCMKTGSFLRD